MAQVTLPYTLTAGTAENVNNLNSNLNALATGVNTIDTAQLTASATKPVTYATLGLDTLDVLTPIGSLVDYAGAGDPTPGSGSIKWLLADGRAVSRTTYAALYAVTSTLYGVGDGVTTFNLPDFRGRVSAGLDNMGTAQGAASRMADYNTRGAVGGASLTTLSTPQLPAHGHTGTTNPAGNHTHGGLTTQMDSNYQHSHQVRIVNGAGTDVGLTYGTQVSGFAYPTGPTYNTNTDHAHGINGQVDHAHSFATGDTGSGATIDIRQAYQVANKIIRVA